MSMNNLNSNELSNALNPHTLQGEGFAYSEHYSSNYAPSYNASEAHQNAYHQKPQDQQMFSGFDPSAHSQYAAESEVQYLDHQHQQHTSQSGLQHASSSVPQENAYRHPEETQGFDGQRIHQVYQTELQERVQSLSIDTHQEQQLHQEIHSYGASQTQGELPTETQTSYSTNMPPTSNQHATNLSDGQSYTTTTNDSSINSHATQSTTYATTTAPIAHNTALHYSQYPSPLSAHTTPHVRHHQVSSREHGNLRPLTILSMAVTPSQNTAYQGEYASQIMAETSTVGNDPTDANEGYAHEHSSSNYIGMLPTPALEPRRPSPSVQSTVQQQSLQQEQPSRAAADASIDAPTIAVPSLEQASSRQQQQKFITATNKMLHAFPVFMSETFKVIRKEKDANEEERQRRAAWETAHDERQTRFEGTLESQQRKLDEMQEKLAKREEELVKREEALAREKTEVDEKLATIESKMDEMRRMIEEVRALATAPPPPLPPPPPPVPRAENPTPVVAQPSPPSVAAAPDGHVDHQSGSAQSSFNGERHEPTFVPNSPPQMLVDSPQPLSPGLQSTDADDGPDSPEVSSMLSTMYSITASGPSQQIHASNYSAPPPPLPPALHHAPMPVPMAAHSHAPPPFFYYGPTHSYYPPIPTFNDTPYPTLPVFNIPAPPNPPAPPIMPPNNDTAAGQYLTPDLTPDLPLATGTRALHPHNGQEVVPPPKKRKAKSKPVKKRKKKKRKTRQESSSESDSDSGSEYESDDESGSWDESEAEVESRRKKRRENGHDKSIITLPHALRAHIYYMMGIVSDKALPDSHDEGTVYHPSQPVRFVWEKTCKQSVHNGRMKQLILEDLKEKKATLYPKIPPEEFSNKTTLERKFDNVFETMRGKYRTQRSEELAAKAREKEARKARSSRHSARKGVKLSDRSETRLKMPKYEPVVFDPALMRECMSSDESDVEVDAVTHAEVDVFCARGPAWRSARLVKFYHLLEENKVVDPNVRPKGGVGKKRPRRVGPPKDEFILPPKGIAPWMLSRRWVEKERRRHVDLDVVLGKLVADEYVLDGEVYQELGEESEVDEDSEPGNGMEMNGPTLQEQAPPRPIPPHRAHMRTLRLEMRRQQ